jgi:hypothetical protein
VLYINIDSQEEAYTEAEVRQAHDNVAQLAAVGAHNLPRMSSGSESSATSVCALSTSTIIWTKSWMSELARLSRAGFLAFDRVTFNGSDQELASSLWPQRPRTSSWISRPVSGVFSSANSLSEARHLCAFPIDPQ